MTPEERSMHKADNIDLQAERFQFEAEMLLETALDVIKAHGLTAEYNQRILAELVKENA